MKNGTLKLVCTTAILFTTSLSVSAHSQLAFVNPDSQRSSTDEKARTRGTRGATIFVFHTDEFWLNLHHFLYVLGRAENKERDGSREAVVAAPVDQERGFEKLSETDKKVWSDAVASYADGTSKKDLVFDDPLPALTNALARAGDGKSLTEIDPVVVEILQRAAPIYRRAWWKEHQEANRKWSKAINRRPRVHHQRVQVAVARGGFSSTCVCLLELGRSLFNERQLTGHVEPRAGQSRGIWFGNNLSRRNAPVGRTGLCSAA